MLYWSENIRYLRNRLGRSQQRLADDLGITRTRYCKYEYGQTEPPIELLVKLAEYFGVGIAHLIETDLSLRERKQQ